MIAPVETKRRSIEASWPQGALPAAKHSGIVVSDVDPESRGRIRVRVPYVTMLPDGDTRQRPDLNLHQLRMNWLPEHLTVCFYSLVSQ